MKNFFFAATSLQDFKGVGWEGGESKGPFPRFEVDMVLETCL